MKYLGEGKPQYLELGGGGTSVGELRIQFSHFFILNLINMAKKIQYHLIFFQVQNIQKYTAQCARADLLNFTVCTYSKLYCVHVLHSTVFMYCTLQCTSILKSVLRD